MALLSMTGFGEARIASESVELVVEIKSVNHRFLDVNAKLPNVYSRFEIDASKTVKAKLKRGRVDLYVTRADRQQPAYEAKFNETLFNSYLEVVRHGLLNASATNKEAIGQAVIQILGKREVLEFSTTQADVNGEWELLEKSIELALDGLLEMRTREGEQLEREILTLVDALEKLVAEVAVLYASLPGEHRQRLLARLEKMNLDLNQLDPDRLAQEVAYFVDRADVTEEIARLGSHLGQFRTIIHGNEGGRKLEFLLQEFGREFNTIGSKSQSVEVTALVVEGKAVVEKIREQVANIE